MSETKWYLRTQDETFGPESESKLVEWARLGRIQPGQEISDDNITWTRVEDVAFLDMRFSIDIGDGNPRGPFNRAAADALIASGRLPKTATVVETREPFPEPAAADPEPAEPDSVPVAADPVPVEPEVRIVEKPVEKIVEVEKVVEKVVEVEKIVVDETRVKELEGLLEEERRHTAELQSKMDAMSKGAADASRAAAERESAVRAELREATERGEKYERALKDATDRENKYVDQVKSLEDELRRLPQAASEVADIQAAVYEIIKGEADDLGELAEREKKEFEEIRKRYQDRANRLTERRREMLKRAGNNIEEMTRKALLLRPEDPRTAQLRRELDELRRTHERAMLDDAEKIRELTEKVRQQKADGLRVAEGMKDVTQLRQEVQALNERLQSREKELIAERQRNEELARQQATRQQTLLARLATLESPSIGTSQTMSTNQSREARQVKLPSWLRLHR